MKTQRPVPPLRRSCLRFPERERAGRPPKASPASQESQAFRLAADSRGAEGVPNPESPAAEARGGARAADSAPQDARHASRPPCRRNAGGGEAPPGRRSAAARAAPPAPPSAPCLPAPRSLWAGSAAAAAGVPASSLCKPFGRCVTRRFLPTWRPGQVGGDGGQCVAAAGADPHSSQGRPAPAGPLSRHRHRRPPRLGPRLSPPRPPCSRRPVQGRAPSPALGRKDQ